jgi:hypothetical protein
MNCFRGLFWFALTILFSALAYETYRVKTALLPKAIEEARSKAASINIVSLGDLRKLKPVFDHTLTVEICALVLTAIAALYDSFSLLLCT